jgi:hypothetical protein
VAGPEAVSRNRPGTGRVSTGRHPAAPPTIAIIAKPIRLCTSEASFEPDAGDADGPDLFAVQYFFP